MGAMTERLRVLKDRLTNAAPKRVPRNLERAQKKTRAEALRNQ
jgi:hypothetical protein